MSSLEFKSSECDRKDIPIKRLAQGIGSDNVSSQRNFLVHAIL